MRQISRAGGTRLPRNMPAKTKLIRMPGIARHTSTICSGKIPWLRKVPSG